MRKYELVTEIELTQGEVTVKTCDRVPSVALNEAFSLLRTALSLPESYYFRAEDRITMCSNKKIIGSF